MDGGEVVFPNNILSKFTYCSFEIRLERKQAFSLNIQFQAFLLFFSNLHYFRMGIPHNLMGNPGSVRGCKKGLSGGQRLGQGRFSKEIWYLDQRFEMYQRFRKKKKLNFERTVFGRGNFSHIEREKPNYRVPTGKIKCQSVYRRYEGDAQFLSNEDLRIA